MALKLEGKKFNLGLAAFAGGAVALFLASMPADLFEELVAMSGISDLVAAAQPPLGTTARLAVSAFAGGAVFLLVLMLLRMLDPPAAIALQVPADEPLDEAWEPARVRRADVHPDAPTRRPIFAGHEFGEPADLAFLSRARDIEDVTAAADASFDPDATLPVALAGSVGLGAAETTLVDVPNVQDPLLAEPSAAELTPLELVEYEPLDQPMAPVASSRDISGSGQAENDPSAETLMARLPLPETTGESIASLLQRLDVGVRACEWPIAPDAGETPEPVDDRLRNVLEDLQKLAARS